MFCLPIFKIHITATFNYNSLSSTLSFNNVHSHVAILPQTTIIYKISIFRIHITYYCNCNSLSSTLAFNNVHSHVAHHVTSVSQSTSYNLQWISFSPILNQSEICILGLFIVSYLIDRCEGWFLFLIDQMWAVVTH